MTVPVPVPVPVTVTVTVPVPVTVNNIKKPIMKTKLVKIVKASPFDWYKGAVGQEMTVIDYDENYYTPYTNGTRLISKSDCKEVKFSFLRIIAFKGYSEVHDMLGGFFWLFILSCVVGVIIIGINT